MSLMPAPALRRKLVRLICFISLAPKNPEAAVLFHNRATFGALLSDPSRMLTFWASSQKLAPFHSLTLSDACDEAALFFDNAKVLAQDRSLLDLNDGNAYSPMR